MHALSSDEISPFSDHWYRVRSLTPRLPGHVFLSKQQCRGTTWYVAEDRATGQFHRFGEGAHRLVRLMDGSRTVEAIWQSVVENEPAVAPTQVETVELLVKLHVSDMLRCNVPPDAHALFGRYEKTQKAKRVQRWKSPLFTRFSLFDPQPLLERTTVLANVVFSRVGLILWLIVVCYGGALAALHWQGIASYWSSRALLPHNIALIALVYVAIKAVHELAHALAVRRWHGEVREMGVMLLIFMPVPYVDASQAWSFEDKRKRMLVSAAGIMAELFVAACACVLWSAAQTGVLRDAFYDAMLIGGVSTLLFNGNPLLRFDGYYVLSDAIEIPNLAQRSARYYGYLFKRRFLRLKQISTPVHAHGEGRWFLAYGAAAFAYRTFIMVSIVLFISGQLFIVGVLLAGWVLIGQLVVPMLNFCSELLAQVDAQGARSRVLLRVVVPAVVVASVLMLMPIPSHTHAQGVVSLAKNAEIRASVEGMLTAIERPSGARVGAGEKIFTLVQPDLNAEVKRLNADLKELRARYDAALSSDPAQAAVLRNEIGRMNEDLAEANARASALDVTSPSPGVLIIPRASHMLGRFVRKGDVLGFVRGDEPMTVRAVVTQDDVDRVRQDTQSVEIRLAGNSRELLQGQILEYVPSATQQLPSKALGALGGGAIALDPNDSTGTKALEPVFEFNIEMTQSHTFSRAGGRAFLRFRHTDEPLARRWLRSVRQLFLEKLAT